MSHEEDSSKYHDGLDFEEAGKAKALSMIFNTGKIRDQLLKRSDSLVSCSESSDTEKETNVLSSSLFEEIPEYPHSTQFQRVIITEALEVDPDTHEACTKLKKCLELREKWISAHPFPPQDLQQDLNSMPPPTPTVYDKNQPNTSFRRRPVPPYDVFSSPIPPPTEQYSYQMVNGVAHVWMTRNLLSEVQTRAPRPEESLDSHPFTTTTPTNSDVPVTANLDPNESKEEELPPSAFPVLTFNEFVKDYYYVKKTIYLGPLLSYSHKRLELLSAKFSVHTLLNSARETDAQKSVPHRDFYNVRKVDTHVHHSACMNQKHLLRFIKSKLKRFPHEVVVFRDGKFLTLEEVFRSLHLSAYDLSIDTLDMHANNTFHRFDRFNLKYNPAGQSRLREIFLKAENVLGGSYLAEITKEVIEDLEVGKYTLVEWRISIYGRKASEWENLSRWFYTFKLAHSNVRWLIQIPRLFHIYQKGGELRSFGQMMTNIFAPLIAVTLNPSSNLPLHYFLLTVVGFDSVDDESRPEHGQLSTEGPGATPDPDHWTIGENPPYGYWMYYMYANICVLNKLRASLGRNTFQFRPHCGEAGDPDHLISTFLLANQINHGILLRKNAALHYLYYLSQIGIAISPLSNNKLFLEFNKSPFIRYFQQGMNVSLSTDDPLMLHITKDALLEEYSVAAQVWKLTSTDQCEIARLSVLQSGWEDRFKRHFLGADYQDIRETNVPEIRLMFRKEALEAEREAIKQHAR